MTATVSAPTGFEPLDPAIRDQYDRDGFVVIPNALAEEDRAYFEGAVDRIYAEEEAAGQLRPDGDPEPQILGDRRLDPPHQVARVRVDGHVVHDHRKPERVLVAATPDSRSARSPANA